MSESDNSSNYSDTDQVDNLISSFYSNSDDTRLDTDEEDDIKFYDLYDKLSRSSSPIPVGNWSTPKEDDGLIVTLSSNSVRSAKQHFRDSNATITGIVFEETAEDAKNIYRSTLGEKSSGITKNNTSKGGVCQITPIQKPNHQGGTDQSDQGPGPGE